MDAPCYSVIVPMRQFRADEPVLASLRETLPADARVEILVAEGNQPSLQRNRAMDYARGGIVLFLDNDCRLATDFWTELDKAFSLPDVEIVGGPARLRSNAGAWEEIFHGLLTHPLIVGSVAARYAPRGSFRRANETELILCNLAVKKAVFARIGSFSGHLYPNEENEWLDRASAAGVGIYYQPSLQVFRPQRATFAAMARMLVRNGMGRTRQFQVSGWHFTIHQILPLLLLAGVGGVIFLHLEIELVALWLVASVAIAFTCDPTLKMWQRFVAGLIAPLVPLTYIAGQTMGWIALLIPERPQASEVIVYDERGRRKTPL